MIIDCISDMHGDEPKLEGGDILIVAGDCTGRDLPWEWERFFAWVESQNYEDVILVAGNHDGYLEERTCEHFFSNLKYLEDKLLEYKGLRIYGTPWTPIFCNWHFMLPPGKIQQKWDLIPDNLDILITHGPPYSTLDGTCGNRHGCPHLLDAVVRAKPKHHVFGHIHESGGKEQITTHTHFHNVSTMNEQYDLVRGAKRIIL